MRAARAEPEAGDPAREARSDLSEGEEDDRKLKERAGALDDGFRALEEVVAVVVEKEVGAAAAIALGLFEFVKEI